MHQIELEFCVVIMSTVNMNSFLSYSVNHKSPYAVLKPLRNGEALEKRLVTNCIKKLPQ